MQTKLYQNLPSDPAGWSAICETAKDTYWKSRRDGESETTALLHAIDVALEADRKING